MRGLREKRRVVGPAGTWEVYATVAEDSGGGLARLRPHLRSARGSEPSAIHIEALSDWYPGQERLFWTTTDTSLERVLDEIEEGLVRGEVVQPSGAVFFGDEPGPRHVGVVLPDVPMTVFDSIRRAAVDAYELVDQLPHGRARRAAWNTYALQTYGDKLLDASQNPDFVSHETAEIAGTLFELAAGWLRVAMLLSGDPNVVMAGELQETLPKWHTVTRSRDQLDGMRETLEALRTHSAYALGTQSKREAVGGLTDLDKLLAEVDKRIEDVALLWIARQPAELRRGIGSILSAGLNEAYALGQAVALVDATRL